MAYEIVCESESKRYRSDCASVLTKTCEILKSKNIIAQFSLVGSGAKNLITRNGNGPYDLDYNLVVIKADERYWKNLRLLKDTVRNALNKAERKDFFSDAMDSRSCLTTLLHFNDSPNVEFSFDVAILTKNRNGDYMRLIHNKNAFCVGYDQYTWNEVPKSHDVKEKADAIKAEGLWQEARDRYVELKSMYLSRQDNTHPSFIVYVEAKKIIEKYDERGEACTGYLERYAFYDKAEQACYIVQSGETSQYANIILQKGVVKRNK